MPTFNSPLQGNGTDAQYWGNHLAQLYTNPSSFTGTPGYTFARDEALGAAQRAMAARGMGMSGNLIQDQTNRAAGLASQNWSQNIADLSKLYGIGAGMQQQETGARASVTAANSAANANMYNTDMMRDRYQNLDRLTFYNSLLDHAGFGGPGEAANGVNTGNNSAANPQYNAWLAFLQNSGIDLSSLIGG